MKETSLKSQYLSGVTYDSILLIFAPLISLAISFALAPLMDHSKSLFGLALPLIIMSFGIESFQDTSTIFRAYLNPAVFKRYWGRLTLVPLAGLLLVFVSNDILLFFIVLDVFWDLYHSSMQTFGIGRVYHVMAGAKSKVGRWQDITLNIILYVFPIFALLRPNDQEFIGTLYALEGTVFSRVTFMADALENFSHLFYWPFTLGEFAFIFYYIWITWRQAKSGEPVSIQKLLLYAVPGFTVYVTWHFCPPLVIYISLELYHAMHTFGITLWSEKKTLQETFNIKKSWTFFIFIAAILAMAGGLEVLSEWANSKGMQLHATNDDRWLFEDSSGLGLIVKLRLIFMLLHAWSDIWIWSVRKEEVENCSKRTTLPL